MAFRVVLSDLAISRSESYEWRVVIPRNYLSFIFLILLKEAKVKIKEGRSAWFLN